MPLLREDPEQAQILPGDGALHQRRHVDAAAEQIGHDRGITAAGNALDVELAVSRNSSIERCGIEPAP